MKNLIAIIFTFLVFQVEAQYFSVPKNPLDPTPPPTFSVTEKRGCALFTIQPNTPFGCGDPGKSCTAILGNGDTLQFNEGKILPYPTAGNFTLEIVFGASGTSVLDIEVFPNIQPTFELYSCTGNQVSVKVTDTNYDLYDIDYDDGGSATVSSLVNVIHPFGSPGIRSVSVHGKNLSSEDNCFPAATQTINVTPTLQQASISQLEVLDASKIKLDHNKTPVSNELSTQYLLQISPNSNIDWQTYKFLFNSITTTLSSSITPENNFYCFRLGTIDVCDGAPVHVPISYSNEICSANFDLNMVSDFAKMTWSTYSPGSEVSDLSIAKTIDNVPAASISKDASDRFDDDDTNCNMEYCYQLTTNYIDGSKSISLQKCETSFSNIPPSPIEDISAVVSETGAVLTWIQDPLFVATEYTINKSTNGSYGFLANTVTPTYNDLTYLTESSSCYKISYTDACQNSSLLSTEAACPIQLSGSVKPNNDIDLSWSAYTGWKNGVKNYVIQKFTSQGQLLETIDNGLATTYSDVVQDFTHQTYVYVITANANDVGVSESISNAFTITKDPYLTYPTAFSPRGNQPKNQLFKVFGQYVSSFELRIFNRWGQEMFYTNNFDIGWDGTYSGNLMPEGTYVFTAQITDQEGRTFDRSGTVVLLIKK